MTRTQLINKSLEPYLTGEQEFCVVGDSCRYRIGNNTCAFGNNTCAFGKHIPDGVYLPKMERKGARAILEIYGDQLPPYIKLLTPKEWSYVQNVHDCLALTKENPQLNYNSIASQRLKNLKESTGLPLKKLTRLLNEYVNNN